MKAVVTLISLLLILVINQIYPTDGGKLLVRYVVLLLLLLFHSWHIHAAQITPLVNASSFIKHGFDRIKKNVNCV